MSAPMTIPRPQFLKRIVLRRYDGSDVEAPNVCLGPLRISHVGRRERTFGLGVFRNGAGTRSEYVLSEHGYRLSLSLTLSTKNGKTPFTTSG
jgi:hypothetical protein